MAEGYLGDIKMGGFNFAPKGWAMCNGQFLAINQNQALFSILGTTYGGNGVTTFALPNLQGRVPVHVGNNVNLGQVGGESNHTLLVSELPAHTHSASGTASVADNVPSGTTIWAKSSDLPYGTTLDTPMAGGSLANTGGSQPHNNMQPYVVLNFFICLQGIFPSRN